VNSRYIENYNDELFVFMSREEGCVLHVYPCSVGVPTIGIGYALAEKNGGSFKIRSGLEDDLLTIDKFLTEDDKARLIKICSKLNDGTIKKIITGKNYNDKFDLTITTGQVKQLFNMCVTQYNQIIKQKLGLKLYKQLQNSREMVVIFSLTYNGPGLIGKNFITGIKEGNRAKVTHQISVKSNSRRDVAVDNRRQRETNYFGRYDGAIPTKEELRKEDEVAVTCGGETVAYYKEINAKRNPKSVKRASGPRAAHNNRKKQLASGAVPNQQEIRRRIDQVKAHLCNDGLLLLDRLKVFFEESEKVIERDWNHHLAGFDDKHYHKRWS
jgi:GH24 family phage-related lysozyme (muramidase)